jgi:beta-phosphoglucomutase
MPGNSAIRNEVSMEIGVIFDMDGVLVDSAAPHHESWRRVAAQHGIGVSEADFKRCFGRPSRDIVRVIWGEETDDEAVARYDAEKEAAYRRLIRGRVPLMPGCRAVLERLSGAGISLAVGTSGPAENLELVLSEGGIGGFFAATVNGFDVRRGKPAPDCFLLAAERLGLPAEACVVIEDAPVGARAGVAAGAKVIALTGSHAAPALRDAGAALTVDHLDEVTVERVRSLVSG